MPTSLEDFRRRFAGVCLIAGPVAMAAAMALKTVSGGDSSAILTEVAADPSRFRLSILLQLVAALLMVAGLAGLPRLFPGRGAVLGHLGIALLWLNMLGNLGDAASGSVLSAMAAGGVTDQKVAIADAVAGEPVFMVIQFMVLIGLLGFVLLAVALFRARTVPWAVPALLLATLVSFLVPITEAVGGVLLVLAYGSVGTRFLRPESAVNPAVEPAVGR
ncbi:MULTISPECIES: hypothetical protein [Microbispora]|uniref:DUF4386 family protein n=1 Tax=Microbispora bryophytorum TaxID=1460882 RepID=A0A8H9GXD0_9ACTN|nr:hypothetical protein [Microbispora bryophytorum]MBD3139635.1 hypothetical protein [Microbispora bryophytorum]TQS02920.1 hypothetical protein FLX07_26720 [Microbispora bryophytorum]GGO03050.1 hypothetical protein GCM10011574_12490 [Microbispora bryophytorum]